MMNDDDDDDCWLGDRKGIRTVKSWVLVCWWWRFDWIFARLIAPVVTTSSIIRLRNDLYCVEWDVKLNYAIPSPLAPIKSRMKTLWYRPCNPGPRGKWPLERSERESCLLRIINRKWSHSWSLTSTSSLRLLRRLTLSTNDVSWSVWLAYHDDSLSRRTSRSLLTALCFWLHRSRETLQPHTALWD